MVRPPPVLLLLCSGVLAAPVHAFAADPAPPYLLVGDQTPPDGHEYTSPQPAIATASSTCPDWSCGADRSAEPELRDSRRNGVQPRAEHREVGHRFDDVHG